MVQSIERAMQIVDILVSDDRKTTWVLSEIAERVNLPLSTTHRLINALMKQGLVMQIPETKHYKLGYRWMEIGFWLYEHLDFRETARPIMEQLAEDVQESVYFSIPKGDFAVIIERVDSPVSVRIIDNLGERIPLHTGAANKTMLAFMKPDHANPIIDRLLGTGSGKQKFNEQLEEIREKGYAVSQDEKTKGTTSIAAPVIGMNRAVIGSLYINLLTDESFQDRKTRLTEKVVRAAKRVSEQTGKAP